MAKLLYKDRQGPQPSPERGAVRRQISRNHQFDLLRIIFATLVLLSHAPEITDGDQSRELFHRFTRAPMTFGTVGVDGFFLLSGYLIVGSWLSNPELLNFLRKRALRIVPGYLVAVVLSTLAVGALAPGVPHFFRGLDVHFVRSVALLSSPMTPPVFPGRPYEMVNAAMYTIAYEFRCYLLVALLGLSGLLRRPVFVMAITLLLLFSLLYAGPFERMHWPRHVEALIGQPFNLFRLTAVYLTGRLPVSAITEDEIDRLLGCVLSYSDEAFDQALRLGFGSAIRREWAWRESRGESLANLAAFAEFVKSGAEEAT